MPLLEIACFTPESAITAWKAGADRIELCENREAGGTTPSMECLVYVKKHIPIPIFVMIRARGGDFEYSTDEFERMKTDIDSFKRVADGFVLGVLDKDHRVDVARTTSLVNRASPLPCTFHRAFDEVREHSQALEDVTASGCQTVLSSGGASDALTGATVLRELVIQAQDRIKVIAGGGVRAKNLVQLHTSTGAHGYHSSGILSGGVEADSMEVRQMKTLMRVFPTHAIEDLGKVEQTAEGSVDGKQTAARLHHEGLVAAVSTGTNTPTEELNRQI